MTPAALAQRNRTRILLAFAAVYVIWGSTYLFIKFAIESIPPFMMGAARFIVAGALLTLSVGITVVLEYIAARSRAVLDVHVSNINFWQSLYLNTFAFISIWVMFLLIYRFLPARRIPWRIAFVSALFSSVAFELLKSAFAWYVAYVANYRSTYGYFTSLVVLVFWIYYSAVVFVLGGEVGQIYDTNRIRRRQRELLD